MENKIDLVSIKKQDNKLLYDILKNREKVENISHKKMPTYNQHILFVNSKPYQKWYKILYQNNIVGTVYLSKINEIGIHLINNNIDNKLYKKIIKEVMEKNPKERYLVNVAIKNKKFNKLIESYGFEKIQTTFELNSKKLR